MRQKIHMNAYACLCAICIIIYLFLMKNFYVSIWQVPDFGYYAGFASLNMKANDGFSSMFVSLSGLLSFIPMQFKIVCLFFNVSAIAGLLYFYYYIVKKDKQLHSEDVLTILITVFSSFWYYGYGKVYYDIPFTMFTFSVCLYIMTRGIVAYRCGCNLIRVWNLFFAVFGFCFSWKMYNIFLIAGLGLCSLADDEIRNIFLHFSGKVRNLFSFAAMFLFGYLVGNYNFILFPQDTMKGILGYEASSDFLDRLFRTDDLVWDHVNMLPWNFSVMCVITAVCILWILPLCIKKIRFAAISAFMLICFWIFITFFSRGYPWHGFTFGVFMLLLFMFEIKSGIGESTAFHKIAFAGIFIQVSICLCFYIPKQAEWEKVTEQSINDLVKNECHIREDVQDALEQMNGTSYTIDLAVKRNTLIYTDRSSFKERNMENIYFVRSNYMFADPLRYSNLDVWNEIYNGGCGLENADYVIYIIPNRFKIMNDVACLHEYDNYEKCISYEREYYSVYVYRR